jgi:hypothetical protein
MLAVRDTVPKTLPTGFTFVEGEPEFDPAKHLALEKPERVVMLADFGYDEETIAQYPSPVAATSPVRILSEAGIEALQQSIEATMPRMTTTEGGDPRLYYGAYHSRFMRDLASCQELTDYLSEVFRTPIAPHTMAHLGIQLNIGTQPQVEISGWHHDSVSFTVVLSMYDPTTVDGGRFEYFEGTRDEGKRFFEEEGGEIPAERTVAPLLPPGYAGMIQGSAVYHRGAPLRSPGYRASLILSFCARDASYPDGNRAFFSEEYARAGLGDGEVDPNYTEWARHNAWLAHARLGTIMEELPFTEDRDFIVEQLRQAIAPIERAIERVERGLVDRQERKRIYDIDDVVQITTPRFDPGRVRSSAGA